MTEQTPSHQTDQEYRKVAADRIRELDAINQLIPQILTSSATAISALTTSPMVPADQANATDSPELRKELFTHHTHNYMRLVQEINKQLHKQVNALEDANVIPSSKLDYGALEGEDGPAKKQTKTSEAVVTNNGLGNLDISFLNSRAGSMMEGMDPEVLDRTLKILEEMAAPKPKTKTKAKKKKRSRKRKSNDVNMENT